MRLVLLLLFLLIIYSCGSIDNSQNQNKAIINVSSIKDNDRLSPTFYVDGYIENIENIDKVLVKLVETNNISNTNTYLSYRNGNYFSTLVSLNRLGVYHLWVEVYSLNICKIGKKYLVKVEGIPVITLREDINRDQKRIIRVLENNEDFSIEGTASIFEGDKIKAVYLAIENDNESITNRLAGKENWRYKAKLPSGFNFIYIWAESENGQKSDVRKLVYRIKSNLSNQYVSYHYLNNETIYYISFERLLNENLSINSIMDYVSNIVNTLSVNAICLSDIYNYNLSTKEILSFGENNEKIDNNILDNLISFLKMNNIKVYVSLPVHSISINSEYYNKIGIIRKKINKNIIIYKNKNDVYGGYTENNAIIDYNEKSSIDYLKKSLFYWINNYPVDGIIFEEADKILFSDNKEDIELFWNEIKNYLLNIKSSLKIIAQVENVNDYTKDLYFDRIIESSFIDKLTSAINKNDYNDFINYLNLIPSDIVHYLSRKLDGINKKYYDFIIANYLMFAPNITYYNNFEVENNYRSLFELKSKYIQLYNNSFDLVKIDNKNLLGVIKKIDTNQDFVCIFNYSSKSKRLVNFTNYFNYTIYNYLNLTNLISNDLTILPYSYVLFTGIKTKKEDRETILKFRFYSENTKVLSYNLYFLPESNKIVLTSISNDNYYEANYSVKNLNKVHFIFNESLKEYQVDYKLATNIVFINKLK